MSNNKELTFLDLFAGAGGLSEGFIRAGFKPVAHVEMNEAACCTLKTRMAYHHLKKSGKINLYSNYLSGLISRNQLWNSVPEGAINSVFQSEIGAYTVKGLYNDIRKCIGTRKSIDVVVGGPPCQAYSIAGRSRDEKGMQGDSRNWLFKYYAGFLRIFKPKFFVFENVVGLLSAKDEKGRLYLELMQKKFRRCGYESTFQILSADKFGVPQKRKRVILVGMRTNKLSDVEKNYPMPSTWEPAVTINDVISDLPKIQSGEGWLGPAENIGKPSQYLKDAKIHCPGIPITLHSARPNTAQDLDIYRRAVELWDTSRERLQYNDLPKLLKSHKKEDIFHDRFKVVAGDLPSSHTIVAHISRDGHYYIHPDMKQNRSLTPREAARLQTFPDDYYFESVSGKPGRTAAFRQIGNAVPVLLAESIACKLKEVMSGKQ